MSTTSNPFPGLNDVQFSTDSISSLDQFRAFIDQANGLARPSRFQLSFSVANVIQNDNSNWDNGEGYFSSWGVDGPSDTQRVCMFCYANELPGKLLSTHSRRDYGPTYKLPYQSTYDDITLQFYVGADMHEKLFFDSWIYNVEDYVSKDLNYLSEYAVDMVITQFDEQNNAVYQAQLVDCWPIGIDSLHLNAEQSSTPHKFSVRFTYREWVPGGLPINSNDNGTLNIVPITFSKNS